LTEAAAAFDQGLAELGSADEALRLQLEAGWMTVARLDATLRPEAARRFEPLIAAPHFGTSHAERVLLANVANQLVFAAEPRARAIELARRALAGGELMAEEGAAGMAWILAVGSIGWADELDECAAISAAAVDVARERGSVYGFAQTVYLRSFAAYYRGDLANAQADLELAIDARRDGWEQFLDAAIGQHAWALVDRGQPAEAEHRLTPAIERSRDLEGPMLALMLEARARAHLAEGRSREALEDALEAGRLMTESLIPNPAILPWRASAATAAAQLGLRDQAIGLTEEEVELARTFGAPRVTGMALRGAGIAHGGTRGTALLKEAVATLEHSPARLELARALVDLGTSLRHDRQAVAAREPLRRGVEMARGFGAWAIERRGSEELAAAGARPRGDLTADRAALTPSELRIASMAADGYGNREIAQALFLTVRTVETHLTHAYRKLEIASRAELPAALAADR
jgi:DNA-binding CsgD family transcriptional regulator